MRIRDDAGDGISVQLEHPLHLLLPPQDDWQAGGASSSDYHGSNGGSEVPVILDRRAPPSSSASAWERDRRWGIVVDAGSSGSRLQVYSWLDHAVAREQRKAAGHSVAVLPRIEKGVQNGEGWTLKVEPGLSSLADHPEDTGNYLAPLFDHAKSIIPPSQLSSTPVYILATAGMRLLSDSQSFTILARACSYIRNATPFHINNCDEQVRIISGEEEGIYGWVAINYLMDGFDAHGLADKGRGRHSSTYGFLDMGGASTQIAFEPSTEARKEHADNLLSVNLRLLDGMDVHHPVFVTTWLGYGTNQARERYVDATLQAYIKEHGKPFASSTSPEGESALVTIQDPCLPKDLLLTEKRHKGYAFKGTGDFKACLQRSAPLLNSDKDCKDAPCLMGVHVPPIDFEVNHFIGISEYWYSTQDIWRLGGVYDFTTFEQSALEYCSQGWDRIISDHSEGGTRWQAGNAAPDMHRLEMQCFKAAWIVNVLHDGIGIPRLSLDRGGEGDKSNSTEEALLKAGEKGFAARPPSFQSVNEINSVAVSWTLGRMVLEVTDNIPKSSASVSHDHDEDAGTPVFEWKTGHSQHWYKTIGSLYRSSYMHQHPLFAVIAGIAAFLLLFLACSRRRKGSLFRWPSRRPSRDDYGLISLEEGGSTSSPLQATSPRKASNPLSRTFLQLRMLASRVLPSSVHAASSTKPFLPLSRTSSSIRLKPISAESLRGQNKLRHSASSPNLSGSVFPRPAASSSSSNLPFSTTSSPGSSMHIDLPAGPNFSNGQPPPLTPPARSNSPGWALRMTSTVAPHNSVSRSQSARGIHRSSTSASDSDGYLSVPVGVSSTAPNVGPNAWEASNGASQFGNRSESPVMTPEEDKPALRSRQSSYTNLSGLARNRGGHSRQISTDVH